MTEEVVAEDLYILKNYLKRSVLSKKRAKMYTSLGLNTNSMTYLDGLRSQLSDLLLITV